MAHAGSCSFRWVTLSRTLEVSSWGKGERPNSVFCSVREEPLSHQANHNTGQTQLGPKDAEAKDRGAQVAVHPPLTILPTHPQPAVGPGRAGKVPSQLDLFFPLLLATCFPQPPTLSSHLEAWC